MANFRQHLAGGTAVGLVGGAVSLFSLGLSIPQSVVAFILGCLGGILPDIDSDSSKPVQFLFGYLGVILPVAVILQYSQHTWSMEMLLLCTVGGYFVVHHLVASLFLKFTTHRGIIHSIPATIICGLLTYLLFGKSDTLARILFAAVSALGYLIHLILDEIWAIDLMGLRLKKSFGSALTLKSSSKRLTLLAYTIIIILITIIICEGKTT